MPHSDSPSPSAPRRVGIREIARVLDVSLMTVSLALRNSPKVSEATRRKVRQTADKLGYRPDPELARLMTRLHGTTQSSDRPHMAILDISTTRLQAGVSNYCESVRQGAITRIESLGYLATCFHLLDYEGDLQRLLKVLHYRGIRGVLLLPPLNPVELPLGLDWSPFSVIAATYAITPLQFHRVVPHQFIDMCQLIRTLEQRGHQRIGAVFGESFERRIHYHFTAALALHKHDSRIYRVRDGHPINAEDFVVWVRKHRPDVLITGNAEELLACLPPAKGDFTPPQVVSFRSTTLPEVAYWDERPEEIGAVAAVLLSGMIQHNETDIPASPRTTMIHGAFHEASAAPAKRAAPARARAKTPAA